jgi:cytidylate kinase
VLIAIDGPSGSGKSTVARTLAQRLGYAYLDSGAMYRCVGLLSLRSPTTPPADLARAATIMLDRRVRLDERVWLDGRDVSAEIRTPEVTQAASHVAADPQVREALVAKQQQLIAGGDWVVEGRDIGTVVAPHAQLKVFLTAEEHERARRRGAELGVSAENVFAEQAQRDARDATREHSPLRAAPGAVVLDTTELTVWQVVDRIMGLANTHGAISRHGDSTGPDWALD